MKGFREFHARVFRAPSGDLSYILHCRRCLTRESMWDLLPQDAADIHAKWWHRPIAIPVGWANPGGSRACDHRQCPPYACQGC